MRRNVAGDDRSPRQPGLDVRETERLVTRGHAEERAGRVGLELRLFVRDPAIEPARIPGRDGALGHDGVPASLADDHEPRLRPVPPHETSGTRQREVTLVRLAATDEQDRRRLGRSDRKALGHGAGADDVE